jgi:hypothetical protein
MYLELLPACKKQKIALHCIKTFDFWIIAFSNQHALRFEKK